MVEADLFDKLFRVAQIIRRKTEPFGGIQVLHLFLSEIILTIPIAHCYGRFLSTSTRYSGDRQVRFRGSILGRCHKKLVQLNKGFPADRPRHVPCLCVANSSDPTQNLLICSMRCVSAAFRLSQLLVSGLFRVLSTTMMVLVPPNCTCICHRFTSI